MKRIILYLLSFLPLCSIYAQVETRCLSYGKNVFPYSDVTCNKIVHLPALGLMEIARLTDEQNDSLAIYRFGKGTDVSLSLDDGQWINIDGGKLWMMTFDSENALSLNFVFRNFHLAKDSKLYITNHDKTILYGPVTAEAIPEDGVFITDIIKGDMATIYLYEPSGQDDMSMLTIEKAVQGFRNPYETAKGNTQLTSGSDYDVACYPVWEVSSDGVAFIIGADGETSFTGSLMMSTDFSFRPYILTHRYCLRINNIFNTQNASYLFFKFRAKKTTCNGTQEAVSYSFNGSTCRAYDSGNLFALLEISHDVKQQCDIAWLGWDRSTSVPSNACSIYHGSTDNLLKLSFDYDSPYSYQGNDWIYHWAYSYNVGNNNGAPLFNQDKRVVGFQQYNHIEITQHNGVSGLWRVARFEKMSTSWTGGGTDDSRLSNWLDPIGTNQLTMDSYYPATIQGSTYPCGEEVYTVANLPSNCSVTWSLPGASPAVAAMLQNNTPQQNQCTITTSNNLGFNTNLVATIERNGNTIQTVSKNIRHLYFTGSYSQIGTTYHGTTYPSLDEEYFGNNGLVVVNQHCVINIHSPNFASANIYYSGDTPTILSSPDNETISMIISSVSTKAVVTVYVSNGNCDNYQFTIWAYNTPYLPTKINEPTIMASQSENGYRISLSVFEEQEDGSIVCAEKEGEWMLKISNLVTGTVIYNERQTESNCYINTTGWKSGIYLVTGTVGDKVCSQKITIK